MPSYSSTINKISVIVMWLLFFSLPFASFSKVRTTNILVALLFLSTVLNKEFYSNFSLVYKDVYIKYIAAFFVLWSLFLFISNNQGEAQRIITVNLALLIVPFLFSVNARKAPSRAFLENAFLTGLFTSTLLTFREGLNFYQNGVLDHMYFENILVMHRPYYGMFLLVGVFICLQRLSSPLQSGTRASNLTLIMLPLYFILFMGFIYVKMAFLMLLVLTLIWIMSTSNEAKNLPNNFRKYALGILLIMVVPIVGYLVFYADMQKAAFLLNSFNERVQLWECGIESLEGMRNLILGSGFGNEIALIDNCFNSNNWIPPGKNVHNQYLSFLMNNGLIGLMLFLGIFIIPMRRALQNKDFSAVFFMLIILFGALTENTFHRFNGVILFAVFSSLYYFVPKADQEIISSS